MTLAVQMKGFGFWLCKVMYSSMAATSSGTLRKSECTQSVDGTLLRRDGDAGRHHTFGRTRHDAPARTVRCDYIEMFYNSKRRHGYANDVSPVQYEKQYFNRLKSVY